MRSLVQGDQRVLGMKGGGHTNLFELGRGHGVTNQRANDAGKPGYGEHGIKTAFLS